MFYELLQNNFSKHVFTQMSNSKPGCIFLNVLLNDLFHEQRFDMS